MTNLLRAGVYKRSIRMELVLLVCLHLLPNLAILYTELFQNSCVNGKVITEKGVFLNTDHLPGSVWFLSADGKIGVAANSHFSRIKQVLWNLVQHQEFLTLK